MDTKFKPGDIIQQVRDGKWVDVGVFRYYNEYGETIVQADAGGFFIVAALTDPQNARVKPKKEYESPKAAFDDWRNNSHHASALGGDPGYHENPETGENNGDECFVRHEAFAAFRAGMRYGMTGNPFNQK